MPSKSVLCLTVLGGGVLSCELVRRRALVTRISAGVSSHREVGKFSPESNTRHGINTLLLTTRLLCIWDQFPPLDAEIRSALNRSIIGAIMP